MEEAESSLYLELAQHLADSKREHGGEPGRPKERPAWFD